MSRYLIDKRSGYGVTVCRYEGGIVSAPVALVGGVPCVWGAPMESYSDATCAVVCRMWPHVEAVEIGALVARLRGVA